MNINSNNNTNQNIKFGKIFVQGDGAGYTQRLLKKADKLFFENMDRSKTFGLKITKDEVSLHPITYKKGEEQNASLYKKRTPILSVSIKGGEAIQEKLKLFVQKAQEFFGKIEDEFEGNFDSPTLYAKATDKEGKIDKNFKYIKDRNRDEDAYSEFWDYSAAGVAEREYWY